MDTCKRTGRLPSLWRHAGAIPCLTLALTTSVLTAPTLAAGKIEIDDTRWVSIGAGIKTQFQSVENGAPNGEDDSNDFDVSSARIYINGQIHENIGLTFNTEKDADDNIDVLDLIARFEFSPAFNVWMGRMLTPADRIEMNGPYYSINWNQYTVPLYPSDQGGQAGRLGRDEGLTVWGELGKFQYAVGAFDGLEGYSNQSDNLLFAGRFAYNFLNMEDNPGYYTSSTYYGALGNVLTAAVSLQSQSDGTGNSAERGDFFGYTVDVLSETVFEGGSVLTLEAEYKDFDADYTLADQPLTVGGTDPCFCLFDGKAWFATAAYLFPQEVGIGRFQPYLRHTKNDPSDAASSDLTEYGVNYVISGHNAKINVNYTTGDANLSGYAGDDLDTFTIGLQLQI